MSENGQKFQARTRFFQFGSSLPQKVIRLALRLRPIKHWSLWIVSMVKGKRLPRLATISSYVDMLFRNKDPLISRKI
jgi:hypothetical protein